MALLTVPSLEPSQAVRTGKANPDCSEQPSTDGTISELQMQIVLTLMFGTNPGSIRNRWPSSLEINDLSSS